MGKNSGIIDGPYDNSNVRGLWLKFDVRGLDNILELGPAAPNTGEWSVKKGVDLCNVSWQ